MASEASSRSLALNSHRLPTLIEKSTDVELRRGEYVFLELPGQVRIRRNPQRMSFPYSKIDRKEERIFSPKDDRYLLSGDVCLPAQQFSASSPGVTVDVVTRQLAEW